MVFIGFPSVRVKIHYKTNVGRLFTEHVQPRPLDVDSLPTLFFFGFFGSYQGFTEVRIGTYWFSLGELNFNTKPMSADSRQALQPHS